MSQGTLEITGLTCVFPRTGYLVQINANAVWDKNNSSLKMTEQTTSVYIHLSNNRVSKEDCSCVTDMDSQVAREYYVVKLSTTQDDPCSIDCLRLAIFTKGIKDWQMSPDYIPPLLSANPGDTPFLTTRISDLQNKLQSFEPILQQSIAASYVSGERKFAAQQCCASVATLENFLQNLENQLHLHPYYLYQALMSFYLSLFLYLQKDRLEAMKQLYEHEDLAKTLSAFFIPIINNLNPDYPVTPVYEEFILQSGIYQINPLPQQVQCAKQMYLLFQKDSPNTSLCLQTFKIASLEDLPNVVRYSTRGIPIKKTTAPYPNPFGSDIDFYLLVPSPELQSALRDNTLAFYASDKPQGMTSAALYWR
jgi:predicted component of type VI protein secretion system